MKKITIYVEDVEDFADVTLGELLVEVTEVKKEEPKPKKVKKQKEEPNICGKVWRDSCGTSHIAIFKN